MKNVSVIIPAYNEETTIGKLILRIKTLYPHIDIIVVNDGSSDDTGKEAEKAGARVFSHPYNLGNGASVKTGIRAAKGDFLVFMDGDGQHTPEDIEKLLAYLPDYDMVVGERTLKGQASFQRAFGNKIFNLLASYVAKFKIRDLTSGFRAVKTEVARRFLYLLPNTYSYPTTSTLSVLRSGRSIKYVPIETEKRQGGKSNIRIVNDGVRFLMIIIKICTLYSPLRIFLPVSMMLFLSGWFYYLYTFITAHRFTNMSALLFSTSVIVFMMGLISEQICQMRFDRIEDKY
ncbi:MAG: glycosyltransferase family 2 protein [Proteobacteria bacterium]|nr:glycosyltransferase family 2 protein [Pseudomonadota bacterium]